jgi:hypothetical protein
MAEKYELEIVRAFWPEEDKRVNAGDRIHVDAEKAFALIEAGIARRVERKPEPAKAAK